MALAAISLLGLFGCNDKASDDLLAYDFRGKFGYVDRNGNVVIEPQFDEAYEFSDGLAWAVKDGKSGYIDNTGALVIEPGKYGFPFADGLASVFGGSVINKKGDVIIDGVQFKSNGRLSDGLMVVRNSDKKKYGFFDRNGNQVIEFKYDDAREFSDGVAWVKTGGKYGCIDKKGNWVINPDYVEITSFNDGLAFVYKDEAHPICIDNKGSVVIEELPEGLKWNKELRFSEGLACVNVGGKYGYIDKTGRFVINPQFISAKNFSDGLAMIYENHLHGYIDRTGKMVIKPKFMFAEDFSEGLAAVSLKDGTEATQKYFYINKNGDMVSDSLFCYAYDFHNGIAKVEVYDEGINYIDKNGKLLINRNLSHIEKLFTKGVKLQNGIQDYLIDNEVRENLIEKYGKKWYDMWKNLNWRGSYSTSYYNDKNYYSCLNYTYDEEMVGLLDYYPETDEIVSTLYIFDNPGESDLNKVMRVMPDGKVWCGDWQQDYFVNEFNEKDSRSPYVYISLPGVYTPENWDLKINIIYSDEGFRIIQEKQLDYNKDIIIRRDSDGETVRVPYREYGAGGIVSDYDYCIWISNVLNEGNFTIKVGNTISRVTDETKGFKGAVINLNGGLF